MPDNLSEFLKWFSTLLVIVGGGGALGLTLRRRVSRDQTEIAAETQQRSENVRLFDLLEKERSRSERHRAEAEERGKLLAIAEADNKRLREERKHLQAQLAGAVKRLRKTATPEQREVLPTDFGVFDSGGQGRPPS